MATGNLLNEIKDLEPKEFYEKVVGKKFRHYEIGPEQIYDIREVHNSKTAITWHCPSTNDMEGVDTYTFGEVKDFLVRGIWILVD